MTAGNDIAAKDPILFAARLTPHRSLSRIGFLLLMGFLTLVSFAAGVTFWLIGACGGRSIVSIILSTRRMNIA